MVQAAPPSSSLEEKIYRNITIIRTPVQNSEIKLILIQEDSRFVGDTKPPIYRVGIDHKVKVGGQYVRATTFIESFGTDEQKAREAYQRYADALDSGKAYFIDDEEKGLRIAIALDNKINNYHY